MFLIYKWRKYFLNYLQNIYSKTWTNEIVQYFIDWKQKWKLKCTWIVYWWFVTMVASLSFGKRISMTIFRNRYQKPFGIKIYTIPKYWKTVGRWWIYTVRHNSFWYQIFNISVDTKVADNPETKKTVDTKFDTNFQKPKKHLIPIFTNQKNIWYQILYQFQKPKYLVSKTIVYHCALCLSR